MHVISIKSDYKLFFSVQFYLVICHLLLVTLSLAVSPIFRKNLQAVLLVEIELEIIFVIE